MYIYKPPRDEKQIYSVAAGVIITLVFSVYIRMYDHPLTSLLALFLYGTLVLALCYFLRYAAREYEYVLEGDMFYVMCRTGRRRRCLLAFALCPDNLHGTDPKLSKGLRRVNHRQNLSARRTYLVYELKGEKRCLVYEPNDSFRHIIDHRLDYLRHKRDTEGKEL